MTDLAIDAADYAEQVVRLLWPQSERATSGELLALPRARRARLLVPAGNRAVAAAAVRRYAVQRDAGARLRTTLLAAGLRVGVLQAFDVLAGRRMGIGAAAGHHGITRLLREVVSPRCEIAVYVGIPRGNRKPVLLAFDPGGRLLAVGKIAVSPLAARLVRNEAAALAAVADARLKHVVTPRVLYAGDWSGHAVLLQSPLDIPRRMRSRGAAQLEQAEVAISGIGGVSRQRIADGPVVQRLRTRTEVLPQGEARAAALAALQRASGHAASPEIAVGSWHGDWTPWNHAVTPAGVLAWGWERFTAGVPIGWDALHRVSQAAAARTGDPSLALRETRAQLHPLLTRFGVHDDVKETVFALYLVELLVRYTEDVQTRLTAGRRWIQALTLMLDELAQGPARGRDGDPARPGPRLRTAS